MIANAEGPGILNWCLEGLQHYVTSGNRLIKTRKVSVATGNYRTLSDTIRYFVATECELEPGRNIERSAFREAFERWCEEEGIRHPASARKVAIALRSIGLEIRSQTVSGCGQGSGGRPKRNGRPATGKDRQRDHSSALLRLPDRVT